MRAIDEALSKIDPPTKAELGRRVNARPQEVNRWFQRGWAAPKYAPAIERETGVSCSALIADIPEKKKH